jgi:thiamine pyrophosphate-dependent acetolactate synthase large subunit-like protein
MQVQLPPPSAEAIHANNKADRTAAINQIMQVIEADAKETAEKTAEQLQKDLPGAKVPDAAKLQEMQKWAAQYLRDHPKATERQVRRATCKHFNIKIVKK